MMWKQPTSTQQTSGAASETLAGRSREFWEKLWKKPIRKPEPEPPVGRIPEMQLRQIINAINDEDSWVAWRAFDSISKAFGKLNESDVFEIMKAAFGAESEYAGRGAVGFILKMPERVQVELLKAAFEAAAEPWREDVGVEAVKLIVKMPEKFQTDEMWRSAAEALKAALEASWGNVGMEGIRLVSAFPKELQSGLFVLALSSYDLVVRLRGAFWCAAHPLSVYRYLKEKRGN